VNEQGATPLHSLIYTSISQVTAIPDALIKKFQGDLNTQQGTDGNTPLMSLIHHYSTFTKRSDSSDDEEEESMKEETDAPTRDEIAEKVLQKLLELEPLVSMKNWQGSNALHLIVVQNFALSSLQKLLKCKDCPINSQDGTGNTALHLATTKGKTNVVHLLLENGADPNIYNNEGETPLLLAFRSSSLIASILLQCTSTNVLLPHRFNGFIPAMMFLLYAHHDEKDWKLLTAKEEVWTHKNCYGKTLTDYFRMKERIQSEEAPVKPKKRKAEEESKQRSAWDNTIKLLNHETKSTKEGSDSDKS